MRDLLHTAVPALKKGATILYPTDTVWGLGCDATNVDSVQAVSKLKGRSPEKSYVVLLDSDVRLQRHVRSIPEVAWEIIDNSDKPITIVYPSGMGLAPEVMAADGSVAIRITHNAFLKKLIHQANRPLLSTSANLSGAPTPNSFEDITESIRKGVEHIVDLQPPKIEGAKPSSIIKLGLHGEVEIIRR